MNADVNHPAIQVPRAQNNSAPLVPGSDELSARLDALQVCLRELGSDDSLQQMVDGVANAVQRMTAEHGGMAEELLSLFEQLGVVFEVSRSLGSVKSEHDVLDLFIGSLRRSFAGRMISVTRSSADGKLTPQECAGKRRNVPGAPGFSAPSAGWISELVRRSVQHRKVLVDSAPEKETRVKSEELRVKNLCNSSLFTADSLLVVAEAMVGPVLAGDSLVCALVLTRPAEGQSFRASDMLLLESLSLFCGDLIRNHRLVLEMRTMSVTMVRALVSAVDQKDTYTSGHSIRVGFYATLLGRATGETGETGLPGGLPGGLNEKDMKMLQWSALLHDVGKIGIRDDVLKKTGKLTKEEFDHIKEHPVRSYQVVKGISHLAEALDGVLYHHERIDGTGYPEGLVGDEIPLQARIVQIADIFDALTSNRSYRSAYGWGQALEILREGSGTTSDPHLLKLFERAVCDAIGDDPDGWERLTERAERFSEATAGPPGDQEET